MRILMGALTLAALAGCTGNGSWREQPTLAASSTKAPQEYAACLAPKWQKFSPEVKPVATDTGYQIDVHAPFTASLSQARIDQEGSGSKVTVSLPPEWAESTAWANMAKDCL